MAETTSDRVWAPPPGGPGPGVARPGRRALFACLAVVLTGVLAAAAGVVLCLTEYRTYTVPSSSMEPTLRPGDRMAVHRIGADEVRRGDVVVIAAPGWSTVGGRLVVKRVVGIGGDRVSAGTDGRLTVDGTAVPEPYTAPGSEVGLRSFSVTVPTGRLFLLGDNRNDSVDSRFHLTEQQGTVAASGLRGRVEWVDSGSGYRRLTPTRAFAGVGDGRVASPGPLPGYLVLTAVGAGVTLLGLVAAAVVLWVARRRGRARSAVV